MRALKKLGYEVYGSGNVVPYGADEYEIYSVWKNEQQFKNTVKAFINLGCVIVDFSNEPDAPATWIREVIDSMGVQDKVKLIVDCHDLDSIRRLERILPLDEREMFNSADGLIYVSLPIQEITNKLHTVIKPNICLYSYCNEGIVDYDVEKVSERANALVYEGGVNPVGNVEINAIYPYRNLFPIFKELIARGNEVHAIVGNSDAFISGQNTGVVLHEPMIYNKMMEKLTGYKWGILIFNNEKDTEPQVRLTLTNKMFELMMAGVPSLACWCKASEDYVKKHKIGLVFNHISEIGNCSKFNDKYLELVENINVKRKELVMENFLWRLENLYADVLGLKRIKIPSKVKKLSEFEYGKKDTALLL